MWLQSSALFVQLTSPGVGVRFFAHSTCCSVIVMSTIEKKLPSPPRCRTMKGSVSHSSPQLTET